jgi:phosphatidylglycerophosphate synthase
METVVETVFLETTGARHLLRIGGLTALERRVREAAKQGAQRAVVAAEPVAFPRALPIPVEFVAPGTPAPEGVKVERADVVAGIELVDEAARRRAEWQLIRGMSKSFQGPVDALINWRFSMPITRALAQRSLRLTPNQVTVTSILVGLAASVVLLRSSGYPLVAVAGLMFQLNSILDSVDGELARLRFQFSKLGQWLDNVSDDVVDNLFIVSAGMAAGGVWRWPAIAAAGARVAMSLVMYVDVYRRTGTGDVFAFRYWFEADKVTADDVYDPKALSTWLRAFGRRDFYTFAFAIACVCNFPIWVVVHGSVIALVVVSLLAMHYTVFQHRRPPA